MAEAIAQNHGIQSLTNLDFDSRGVAGNYFAECS